jgi:hypothetical protein
MPLYGPKEIPFQHTTTRNTEPKTNAGEEHASTKKKKDGHKD